MDTTQENAPQESSDRPAWTSSKETGGWDAYKHRQISGGIEENYYKKRKGLK